MAEAVRNAFVCGHPIVHSRSPKIHGYWLRKHGIDGSYDAVDVSPEDFRSLTDAVRAKKYVGGNVTLPNKEIAFKVVDRRDDAATAIGAVNTLWMEGSLLCGGNTDAYGFAANLDDRAPGWDRVQGPVIVLGAGGAARAVLYALKARGFTGIGIVNRTYDRASALAAEFGEGFSAHPWDQLGTLMAGAGLLVNTTSLGMHGSADASIDLASLPSHALVTDIVYVPLETPLLASARRRGLRTVDGLGMLLHQAVPGFERWFGIRPDVTTELRDLIIADIGGRT